MAGGLKISHIFRKISKYSKMYQKSSKTSNMISSRGLDKTKSTNDLWYLTIWFRGACSEKKGNYQRLSNASKMNSKLELREDEEYQIVIDI